MRWGNIYNLRIPISFHFPQKVATFFSLVTSWDTTYNRNFLYYWQKPQIHLFHATCVAFTIGHIHYRLLNRARTF